MDKNGPRIESGVTKYLLGQEAGSGQLYIIQLFDDLQQVPERQHGGFGAKAD